MFSKTLLLLLHNQDQSINSRYIEGEAMAPVFTHPWKLNETDALILQQHLASKVIKKDQLNPIHYVAGVDVGYDKQSDQLFAAVVVLEAASLNIVETAIRFPYIPGLFSFRELPHIVKALRHLNTSPDLIICDGQGIAHPRRV
jgi:deoxyribonuclease V